MASDEKTENVLDDVSHILLNGMESAHTELITKYNKGEFTKDSIYKDSTNINDEELMSFNGYYAMPSVASGAFVSIDTNFLIIPDWKQKYHWINIIVSKDGESSISYSYSGSSANTFINNKLTMPNLLNLQFTRENNGSIVASFKGSIAGITDDVSGFTQNNPIKIDTYIGEYYQQKVNPTIPVLNIKNEFDISYDYGSNGSLQAIPLYCYNLNMYYFTVYKDISKDIPLPIIPNCALIMGSAAASGFACNNMGVNGQRSLVTIVEPTDEYTTHAYFVNYHQSKSILPNINSNNLAQFDGYYSIKYGSAIGAFISIQSTIYYYNGYKYEYSTDIGVSLDGKTSKSYKFDTSMSFDGKTLIIPKVLSVDLVREYEDKSQSLVQLNGSVSVGNDQIIIKGYTLFNPVSLSLYNGNYYYLDTKTKKYSKVLNISKNDNGQIQVIYDNNNFGSFIYVPIMYILAYTPDQSNAIVFSLGTQSGQGNANIITKYVDKKIEYIHVVDAIPKDKVKKA